MIDKNKTYRTRDGREVTIYATDIADKFSVHGYVRYSEDCIEVMKWTKEGRAYTNNIAHFCDLIEVKPKIKGWINIYRHDKESIMYDFNYSREDADCNSANNRIACIEIEFEEGQNL